MSISVKFQYKWRCLLIQARRKDPRSLTVIYYKNFMLIMYKKLILNNNKKTIIERQFYWGSILPKSNGGVQSNMKEVKEIKEKKYKS